MNGGQEGGLDSVGCAMRGKIKIEIAVESVEAALAAERGGADRIELCADLACGGLTPDAQTMRRARKDLRIPIHAMIRPKRGDFIYDEKCFEEMRREIALAKDEGMNGVVLGILCADRSVDVAATRALVELARPMEVTFHRAFDASRDLLEALEEVISSGATRVLTSGGANDALGGVSVLRELVQAAGERITVMPGGGIHGENFAEVRSASGAWEFHSGLGTVMPHGSPDLGRFEAEVQKIVEVAKRNG